MRGATNRVYQLPHLLEISTHTPHAGRDDRRHLQGAGLLDFYSHASCEARPADLSGMAAAITISTHTPLARRDLNLPDLDIVMLLISTHTPLARRDLYGRTRKNL